MHDIQTCLREFVPLEENEFLHRKVGVDEHGTEEVSKEIECERSLDEPARVLRQLTDRDRLRLARRACDRCTHAHTVCVITSYFGNKFTLLQDEFQLDNNKDKARQVSILEKI